jgi:competence protein ComEC
MPFNDRTIELLVISHFHSDHIGGFVAISQRYTIQHIWYAPTNIQSEIVHEVMHTIQSQHIPTTIIQAGQFLNDDNFRLIALHPPPNNNPPGPKADPHDATIVFKFTYGSICILLTGDVNTKHEGYIIAAAQSLHESLYCPILKISHHGSKTGSSNVFLANAQPQLAIISVGAKNRYGHPGRETIDRLTSIGATIYRTDQNGTVTVESDGEKYWTRTEK